jgi:flagellar basal-body rod protein FlgG
MIRSLWIAKTGLDSQQTQMDVITNNRRTSALPDLSVHVQFSKTCYIRLLRQPGAQSSQQTHSTLRGLRLGTGVRTVATEKIFTQGNLQQTGNAKDVAIQGQGFSGVDA